MARLQDRVVVVTGGAQGIGRTYCEGLIREGAKVVVADVDAGRATETAEALKGGGAEALAVPTDVSQEADAARLARTTLERFGRIDGLVNNAAIFQRPGLTRGSFEKIPIDEWDRVMAVNLRGIFLCTRAVVPQMKAQRGGKIVNISSGTVFSGTPHFTHYVTSKAGVIGFTRALARELGDFNICVNAVTPGQTLSLEPTDDAFLQRYHAQAQARALKRIQEPADLVGAVIFLLSAESDFITGQTLNVDGGSNMV
jgi:3-oxoacyl-[acyl-carrier protein] reductase